MLSHSNSTVNKHSLDFIADFMKFFSCPRGNEAKIFHFMTFFPYPTWHIFMTSTNVAFAKKNFLLRPITMIFTSFTLHVLFLSPSLFVFRCYCFNCKERKKNTSFDTQERMRFEEISKRSKVDIMLLLWRRVLGFCYRNFRDWK